MIVLTGFMNKRIAEAFQVDTLYDNTLRGLSLITPLCHITGKIRVTQEAKVLRHLQ